VALLLDGNMTEACHFENFLGLRILGKGIRKRVRFVDRTSFRR
jgi:hypothetical protein